MRANPLTYALAAFLVAFGASFAFGQARTPFTRPAYVTTPGPITSSGAITGDTLTATTTSTDAIYLNNGRPICMNAPTCNAASRLFYNGAQIQTGGGFLATGTIAATANFNSSTASGNQAFTCTNTGCRLSLGNTGRYFDDNGTRMQYTGGNFIANVGTNGQFNIDGVGASFNVQSGIINESNGTSPVNIFGGKQTSAADSIGVRLRTRAQSVSGAKIVTYEDGTTVRGSIDYLGNMALSGNISATGAVIGVAGLVSNLYVERSPVSVSIPDDGAGTAAAYTWTPGAGRSITYFTCNDANGCDITVSETGAGNGFQNRAVNVETNVINFTDSAGVIEMAGNFSMGQWDVLDLTYVTDRYVEVSRSNN